ncbi:MAG: SUMF1/EgtB/PvdO family nonheme iron enzyme [Gammaproteobacteria bacterium]|nr:SUMF1/EgtB/PvdO family nonheme iron enzyme [Gammaproteobacteria bacterium]
MKASQHNIKLPLEKLILRLTNAGFKIDVSLRLKMHKALSQLGKKYLKKPEDLGLVLCPLVAKSKAEQERFGSIFKVYIDDNGFYVPEAGGDDTETTPGRSVSTFPSRRLPMRIGVGLAIAFITTYVCWLYIPRPQVVVDFSVTDTMQVGDVVHIENLTSVLLDDSTREQYGFSWEIDDKKFDDLSPSHVFSKPGIGKIHLRAWYLKNQKRSGSLEKSVNVTCKDILQVEFVDFPERGDTKSSLSFSAQIQPNSENLDFNWDFGDGTTSTAHTPVHTFANPGNYEIRLVASRSGSDEDDVCNRASAARTISIGSDKVVLSEEPHREVSEIHEARIAYWVLRLLFLMGFACYMIYEWRRYRHNHMISEKLRQKFTPSDKPPTTIPFPGQDDAIAPEPEFLAFTDSLRERQEGEHHKLDIPATLSATIRKAGFAELCYKRTSKPAEYLFLIDEVNPGSQQFRLFEHMAKSLAKEDVLIKYFFYRSNPEVLWNNEFPGGLRIQELHRLCPDYRLVVFGNGHYLIDPFEGKISQHTYRLYELWQQRAILTSVTPDKWGYKERLLKDLFVLLPADVQGQCMLVESFQRKGQPEFKALHYSLMTRAKRTSSVRPRSSKNLNLKEIKNLKAFLGDDLFKWLAASVVYPHPTWEITLAVGKAISPHLVNYDNILTMSHVPWLQTGTIPRKLRTELLTALKDMDSKMGSSIEKTARKTVISLLAAALDDLQTMSSKSLATCDLNKELTLQRAAFDKEDMEAQQELQYLLVSGKIDEKHKVLINNKFTKRSKSFKFALRTAICLVPWAIMSFVALSTVDISQVPLKPPFVQDVVVSSDIEETDIFNAVVDKYNKAVNIYNKGEFKPAIGDFEEVTNVDGAGILKNKARHGIGLSYYYINDIDKAKEINELLLRAGFYNNWSTRNLNTLFGTPGIPGHQPSNTITIEEFVEISAGELLMGSDEGGANEKPPHKVTFKNAFYMQKTEVTQGQWRTVMDSNPSSFKQGDNYPVENVSWDDVQEFIAKLNKESGENYRLPTEAEWEYAARAGTTTKWYCGDNEGCLDSIAWYNANSDEKTHPVGTKQPNNWGLYNMGGNVWEWCQDWYDDGYYKNSPADDPTGPEAGSNRVIRGGCWYFSARYCRSSDRSSFGPSFGNGIIGFRLVLPQAISEVQPEAEPELSPKAKRDDEQKEQSGGGAAQVQKSKYQPSDEISINEFVEVSAGEYSMGSDEGDENEKPLHRVTINNAFYMQKTEVTQGQWKVVMGSNPSSFKQGDNYPVESVSWDDVQEFITKLNKQTGKNYRLPTEAEWEYAARSEGKSEKYSGFSNDDDLYLHANFCDSNCEYEDWKDDKQNDGYKNTSPVGSFKPNGIGLYDMSGNVWEWCQDWHDSEYYKDSPINDPTGPETGSGRVIRGGGWGSNAGYCRSSFRFYDDPSGDSIDLGFRLVLPQAISSKQQDAEPKRSPEVTRDEEQEVRSGDTDFTDTQMEEIEAQDTEPPSPPTGLTVQ